MPFQGVYISGGYAPISLWPVVRLQRSITILYLWPATLTLWPGNLAHCKVDKSASPFPISCTLYKSQINHLVERHIWCNSVSRILKAHSHSMSGGLIWASLERQCCFWIAGGLVSYLTMRLLTLQLFKISIDAQEKLRLNLHLLSVSELLECIRV